MKRQNLILGTGLIILL